MFANQGPSNPDQQMLAPAAAVPEPPEGITLDELPVGTRLEVDTGHHTYRIEHRGEGQILICGHPEFCPQPVLADFYGSINDRELKWWFIGRGMKLEFRHPRLGLMRTSRVHNIRVDVRVQAPGPVSSH